MTKERIEIIRQSLIPFVKKELLEINYEGLGKSDAKEFEKDLNEILDLAIKALEQQPSGVIGIVSPCKEQTTLAEKLRQLEQPTSKNCVVEDLLKQVYEQKMWLSDAGYNAYNVDIAFKSIVKAIENVHITVSDDCVSRKAMLNAITEIDNNVNMDIYTNEVREIIKALPPVTSTHGTCKDCSHRDPEDKKCDCGHSILWQLPREDTWYCADFEKQGSENE